MAYRRETDRSCTVAGTVWKSGKGTLALAETCKNKDESLTVAISCAFDHPVGILYRTQETSNRQAGGGGGEARVRAGLDSRGEARAGAARQMDEELTGSEWKRSANELIN